MKYISEEKLRKIISRYDSECDIMFIEDELYDNCEELKKLTVSKLWPMSEAPRDGSTIKAIFWPGTNQ